MTLARRLYVVVLVLALLTGLPVGAGSSLGLPARAAAPAGPGAKYPVGPAGQALDRLRPGEPAQWVLNLPDLEAGGADGAGLRLTDRIDRRLRYVPGSLRLPPGVTGDVSGGAVRLTGSYPAGVQGPATVAAAPFQDGAAQLTVRPEDFYADGRPAAQHVTGWRAIRIDRARGGAAALLRVTVRDARGAVLPGYDGREVTGDAIGLDGIGFPVHYGAGRAYDTSRLTVAAAGAVAVADEERAAASGAPASAASAASASSAASPSVAASGSPSPAASASGSPSPSASAVPSRDAFAAPRAAQRRAAGLAGGRLVVAFTGDAPQAGYRTEVPTGTAAAGGDEGVEGSVEAGAGGELRDLTVRPVRIAAAAPRARASATAGAGQAAGPLPRTGRRSGERAAQACSPTSGFTNCTRFTHSGADQTFTVPAGVTSLKVRLWAGGGAGGNGNYYGNQYGGGGGGYTTGTVAVTPGQKLTVTSGSGGVAGLTRDVYGGGGGGGNGRFAGQSNTAVGSAGGGMSALWDGDYGGTALLVAGGGGGASPGADIFNPWPGAGGGTEGTEDRYPAISGRKGTQTQGGAAATQSGCSSPAISGSKFRGGGGGSGFEGGGGGGGGYYGGGGGACQVNSSTSGTGNANGMGGGGSGYIGGEGVSGASTTTGGESQARGQGGAAAGKSDPLYRSGIGDGGGTGDGGNGETTIEWVTRTALSVTKSPASGTYVPGGELTYRIRVFNGGPSPATGVQVRDSFPAAYRNARWTCSADGDGVSKCGAASGSGNIDTTADVAAGRTVTYTVTGTVPSDHVGTVDNSATITVPSGTADDNCKPSCTANSSLTHGPSASLEISKVLQTAPVVPGQQIQWRVTVKNNGPSRARGVVVRDKVPSGVSNPSMTGDSTCTLASGAYSCAAVEIPAGESKSWTLSGTLASDATTTPTNTATVTGGPDPSASERTAEASTSVSPEPRASLEISKTLRTSPVVPGEKIEWQVRVKNNGPSVASGVVVKDAVPSGVTGATMTGPQNSQCAVSAGEFTCPSVRIPVGAAATWTLSGTLDADATEAPENVATVTGGPDPSASERTAVASPTEAEPKAGLEVSKVLLTSPVVAGQQVQWRVTVKNNGPSRARNVVVRDQVPAGVTGATMTGDSTCTLASGAYSCAAVQIPAGESKTWTLSGTLGNSATTTPTNTVTVTGGPDPSASERTAVASASASPERRASLTVSKTLKTSPVVPGEKVEWTVSVTNNGPSRATGVTVRDRVPDGVTGATMTGASACTLTGGTFSCGPVEIAPGATVRWTLSGTLSADATEAPENVATVTGGPDPSASERTAVASPTEAEPKAALEVSKTLITSPVVPGQQIQWRVTVKNNGPSRARNVVVTDKVPDGVTGATMSGASTCTLASGEFNCAAVDVPVGQSKTWTLSGTLDADATEAPENVATVTGGPDPSASERTAVASPTEAEPKAALEVSKTLITSPVVPGQQIQWRVTVKNNGPSRARNVVVKDKVPAGVSNPSMTGDSTCTLASGAYSCAAVDIPAGGSKSWTLSGTLDADATTTPVNTATVTGGPDPSASERTAVASPSTSPEPRASLTVTKTLKTSPVVPGQKVEWVVTAQNDGPSRARNVVVKDKVPDGVTGATMAGASNCTLASGEFTCAALSIPAGESRTWTLSGTLDANATEAPENTVTVTGGPDPSASERTAVASPSTAEPKASLEVSKVLLTSPVVPGRTVQWKVTVTNKGPSRARGVVVKDKVPAGVTGASMSGASNCSSNSGEFTCTAVDIPVGESRSWTLSGTLDADATQAPANTVTVTGGPDPSASEHTAVASPSTASPQAGLELSKTLLTSPVVPGEKIEWKVTVKNNGPSRARNVVVKDKVPDGVTGTTMTGGSTCTLASGAYSCAAVDIPAGGSKSWTLSGTLSSDATTTPANSVTVTGGPDPSASERTAVASPSQSPEPRAGLELSKTLLTSPVVPGQQIQWRVTVKNNGPSRARNVVVKDKVPGAISGPRMAADSDGAVCAITGGEAVCPAVDLAAGASKSYTLSGTLDADATTTPVNTATVTGGPDPSASERTAVASASVSPQGKASLEVSKTLVTSPVVPGQKVEWRVTVKNNGPSRARDVVVKDKVPGGVTGATMSGASNCTLTAGEFGCAAVQVPAGESRTWTLSGTLDGDATQAPENTVTVTGGPDPSASERTAVASPSTAQPRASLEISKTLLTSPVVPGEKIEWKVTVKNNGPSRARNVVVKDRVPAGVSNPSMTGDSACTLASGTYSCAAVDIAAGGSKSWTLSGTLDADATTTPENTATVTGGPDPSASERTAVASPSGSPQPRASLTVSKTLKTSPVVPGQKVEWVVTAKNGGPSRARDVVVKDKVPAGVTGATMSGASNCTRSSGEFTCAAVSIPAGESRTWTLSGTLDADATAAPANTATVTGGPDPSASERTAVASPSSAAPRASLEVSKVLKTSPVVPGQKIEWEVTVKNSGPSRARNVVVKDKVPAGVTGAAMSGASACTQAGGEFTCAAVDIPAGASRTWTLSGTLSSDATTTPANSVTVTGGPDPSASERTAVASPSESPEPRAGLEVSKTLLTSPVVPGQQVQWRVTVKNGGPSRARNVVVKDRVPAGVSNPSMTGDSACTLASGTYSCAAVDIAAGGSKSWTLSGTLAADATTTPENTATVTGGPDPSASERTAVASPSGSPQPRASLTVSKTLKTSPVVPGQKVEWVVTVKNDGPSRARDVVVKDKVPGGVTGATMSGASNCTRSSGEFTCAAVSIPAGESKSWTLSGTLDADATQAPANTVIVTGGPDPSASEHTAVASPTEAEPRASLEVSKVLLTSPVVPGQQVQWRVTVKNGGPSRARNVVVKDRVPAGVSNPSMTGDSACTLASGAYSCAAVEIPAGESKSWTLSGTLAADATTTPANTVTVTGGPDPSASERTAVASPTGSPQPRASLEVSKVLLTSPVLPGEKIEWRVTVKNNGPSRARNVVVKDKVPDGVSGATMSGASGCTESGGEFTCAAVEVPAGASRTWTLSGTLDAAAAKTPTNTVTVTGGPDPSASEHTAVASPSADPQRLHLSKKADRAEVGATGEVVYTLTVANTGGSDAKGVTVEDDLSDILTEADYGNDARARLDGADAVTQPRYAAPRLTWTGDVPRGKSVVITFSVKVPERLKRAQPGVDRRMDNTVTSDTPGSDCPRARPAAACSSTVRLADPSVAKTVSTGMPEPGGKVTYTLTVRNSGTAPFSGYDLTDDLRDILDDATWNGDARSDAGEQPVFDAAGRRLTWRGDLAPGQVVTITYSVTVGDPPQGNARLRNEVTSKEPGSNCPPGRQRPNPECATGTREGGGGIPRLRVEHRVDKPVARPGEQVSYTVTVTNTGSAIFVDPALRVGLDDVLDDAAYNGDAQADRGSVRVAGVPAQRALRADRAQLNWSADSLKPDERARITYTATVGSPPRGNLLLTSYAYTTGGASNCPVDDDSRPECLVRTVVPLLHLAKTVQAPKSPGPGDKVTYTVTVTNRGTAAYTGAGFSDDLSKVLDDAAYGQDARATSGGVRYAAPVLRWRGDVPAGGTVRVSYSFTVKKEQGDRALGNGVTATVPGTNCPPGSSHPDCTAPRITTTQPPGPVKPVKPVKPLPATGDRTLVYAGLGALAIILGLAALAVARRRRRA